MYKYLIIAISTLLLMPNVTQTINPESPLYAAIRNANLRHVLAMLNAGTNSNQVNSLGQTPLIVAVTTAGSFIYRSEKLNEYFNSIKIIELLLEKGAKPNLADADRATPLHYAAAHDLTAATDQLLSYGADQTKRDKWNKTPLDIAHTKKNSGVIQALNQ